MRSSHQASSPDSARSLALRGRIVVLLLSVLLGPAALGAQTSAVPLDGIVLDAAGIPIAGANVSVAGTAVATITDEKGHFRVSIPATGQQKLSVRRLGFQPVSSDINVVAGQSLRDVTIRMTPSASMLNPVLVSAARGAYSGRLAGYYQRLERRSAGYFISRDQIDKKSYRNLSQMLRNVPGINAFPLKTGGSAVRIRQRQCRPLVWLDGVPMPAAEVDLDAFPVSTLHGIEVYSGSGSTPQDFATSGSTACGSIVLWSRGRDTDPLERRAREPMDLEQLVTAQKVFPADQVDQRASLIDVNALAVTYPAELLPQGVSGYVMMQYVVDEKGAIEPETISVVSSSHPLFSAAAALALKNASYRPAMKAGAAVRQVVLQPFNFAPHGAKNTSQGMR
jgi:TonB family protein